LLSRGVDRCGETMMGEFGLVHDGALPQLAQGLTNAARERLNGDLHHLAADLVLSHFPRQEDGRFPWESLFCLHPMNPTFPRVGVGRSCQFVPAPAR
jgi:hypothetical protein